MGSSSNGMDVAATVSQLITAKRVPEVQWQQDITDLQTQATLLGQFNSAVSSLSTKLNALQDPAGALTSMKTSSSNQNLVSASAAPGTVAGSHVIVVSNLASTASWYSDAVATSSTNLAAGSFTLQVGTGTATQITVGSGVNTLDQLVTYINTNDLGVRASVVNDANGARLALVSNTSGEAGDISITGATGMQFTQGVEGKNASLTVDGIPISSSSNVVTGAVNGLTINLLGADPNSQITVGVTVDTAAAKQAISDFVTVYNTIIQGVNAQFKFNSSSNTSGPLAGDPTMRLLQDAMLSAGSYKAPDGSTFTNLGMLGVAMANDGTLSIDDTKMNDALANHFSDVQLFFQGTSSDGFANNLNAQLKGMTNSTDGAFTVDLKTNSSQQTDLQHRIDDFELYIAQEQTRLTDVYNKVNILLAQLPMQIKQIQAALGNDQWGNAK